MRVAGNTCDSDAPVHRLHVAGLLTRLYARMLLTTLHQKIKLNPVQSAFFALLLLGSWWACSYWFQTTVAPVFFDGYAVMRTLKGPRAALSVPLYIQLTLLLLMPVPIGIHIGDRLHESACLHLLGIRLRDQRAIAGFVIAETASLVFLIVNAFFAGLAWRPFLANLTLSEVVLVLGIQMSYLSVILLIVVLACAAWSGVKRTRYAVAGAWTLTLLYYAPFLLLLFASMANKKAGSFDPNATFQRYYRWTINPHHALSLICAGFLCAVLLWWVGRPILAKSFVPGEP